MEIKSGFKQTEVGTIPSDWDLISLRDCLTLLTDFEANGSFASTAENVRVFDRENYAWYVRATDLENHTPMSEVKYVDKQSYDYLKKTALFGGEVLVTKRGEIGKVYMFRPQVKVKATLAPNLYLLKLNDKVIPFLLYYYLRYGNGNQALKSINASTTLGALYKEDVKSLYLPLPPTRLEQEAISEALRDADAYIESLEKLIAKKRLIKQGVMQELLTGKRRLPGFSGKWVKIKLGETLIESPDYGINAPGVPQSGTLPNYLRITDIDDNGRISQINHVAVDHPNSMNYLLSENDIVFARTGASVGKTYQYDAQHGEMVFAGFLIRVKVDPTKLIASYLAYYTHTYQYYNWVRVMSTRTGQPGINGNEYATLDLKMPPSVDEQTAIADILRMMDMEIDALQAKLLKAQKIKQGMMQELLTGRIRLV